MVWAELITNLNFKMSQVLVSGFRKEQLPIEISGWKNYVNINEFGFYYHEPVVFDVGLNINV